MKSQNSILKNQSGLTLIELMVAVSLFTIVMIISTTMFLRSLETQSRSISSKNLQESLSFAMAFISAEAGGAIQDPTGCHGSCADGDAFFCSLSSDTQLVFKKADSVCARYEIEDDAGIPRLKVSYGTEETEESSAYLTPANIRMTSLDFNTGAANDGDNYIGEVTVVMNAQSLTQESQPDSFRLQTTIATWLNQ